LAENGWAAGIWSSAIIAFVPARQTYWPHAELYIDRLLNDIIGILNHTSYLFTFYNNKIDITINWTWLASEAISLRLNLNHFHKLRIFRGAVVRLHYQNECMISFQDESLYLTFVLTDNLVNNQ
jgi:hypothetical protein